MSYERPLSDEEWYDTARAKIETYLPAIDPDLDVRVHPVAVRRMEEGDYETLALSFAHAKNPGLGWTMEIRKDFDYIDRDLESAIKRIYEQRSRMV